MQVGDLTIFFLLDWVFPICSPALSTVKKAANECSVLCLKKKEREREAGSVYSQSFLVNWDVARLDLLEASLA